LAAGDWGESPRPRQNREGEPLNGPSLFFLSAPDMGMREGYNMAQMAEESRPKAKGLAEGCNPKEDVGQGNHIMPNDMPMICQ
jgi:hypothetical protein